MKGSAEKHTLTKQDILNIAGDIIAGNRKECYGEAENSFNTIAKMWSAYLNYNVTSEDVANMMILLKVARNASGKYKTDNWIDICGYAALGGEISFKNKENCEPTISADNCNVNTTIK